MTLEEKISRLQAAAMEEARTQGNAIINQHKEALEALSRQHQEEATRQSETRLRAETVTSRQEINMAASKAQLELKRELSKTQKDLKKQLFSEVRQLMTDYMKTEDYERLLISYIENAASFADGESLTIYINPSDEDKKAYLEAHTGMTLTVSQEDFMGGVRAVIPERNILIDHAFKGAIDNEYHKFSFKGGAGIE